LLFFRPCANVNFTPLLVNAALLFAKNGSTRQTGNSKPNSMRQLYIRSVVILLTACLHGGLRAQTAAPLPAFLQVSVFSGPAGMVHINWAVQPSAALVQYTVQRSADGMFFSTVGTVSGGNGSDYCFTDSFPAMAGPVWYHIMQTGPGGATALSPMRSVAAGEAPATMKLHDTATVTAQARKTAAKPAHSKP
jgi:hypothetical protein